MKNLKMALICFVVFAAAVFITGCAKSGGSDEPQSSQAAQMDKEPSIRTQIEGEYLKVVNFAFDKSDINSTAASILKENAQYLEQNENTTILIEGHCDNRGTTAYNLALGQRRAMKVKEYYVNLGVAPDRIATISYGEEKPVDPAENEEAYAKNRRGETKVVSK